MSGFASPTDRPPMPKPGQSPTSRMAAAAASRAAMRGCRPERWGRAPARAVPSLAVESRDLGDAALEPAHAALRRVARRALSLALARDHVVELHDHVGAEVALDLHHALGRERARRAVDVTAELDAVLAHRAQPLEREHLKPARVGEDRTVPPHEPVQPAQVANRARRPGADAGGTRCRGSSARRAREIFRVERLHRRQRADGHERRRLDGAVRRDEHAGARARRSRRSTAKVKLVDVRSFR